ncbi:hypothetical protein ASL20_22800 [Cupriavidus necator]|uniref:hypothetical protein n=1 Tax=Cupriavidus necator TaxID=106590 RepID=UPI00073531A0|nr:hypothetical protein [Cupriavidus necator]KUE86587.1 hypothetical protein ASL20_22800 [Cupriavidus necator]
MDTPLDHGTFVKVLNARTPRTEFLVGQTARIVAYGKRTGVYAVFFDGEVYAPFRHEDFEVVAHGE